MYEAQCAVVGTVITHPVKRQTASGEQVLSFRMASNARRQNRTTGEWTDGGTLYLTVTCWRRLVTGVGASLMKGDPVVAYGQLRTNEYTTREGVERADLEMTASAVGPDLSRCVVEVDRRRAAAKLVEQDGSEDAVEPDRGDEDEFDEQDPTDPGTEFSDTHDAVTAAV